MRLPSRPSSIVLVLLAAACGQSFSDGSGGNTVSATPCDPNASPTNGCSAAEDHGFFVTTTATPDGADGSKAHPFASIMTAITQAAASDSKKNVYVCFGTYGEQVTLADGVNVYGYFDCNSDWKIDPSQHALVQAPSPALTADKILNPTRVEGIDFTSNDAGPNDTSIGAKITASTALTLANLTIQGGVGGKGDDGAAATQLTQASPDGVAGSAAGTCNKVGAANLCKPNGRPPTDGTCVGATGLAGGPGGEGGTGAGCLAGSGGLDCTTLDHAEGTGGASPPTPTTAGPAYTINSGVDDVAASTGAGGSNGSVGANATAAGTFADDGTFQPASGTAGTDGKPGQGGGGGYGEYTSTGNTQAPGGGSGGAGGCPGLAGGPGKGGGASVGILLIDSAITLDTCILQSSTGGAAGAGAMGSDPTLGGNGGGPGDPASHPVGTAGAHGGAGGESGWSGNGFPGPSYAVAVHGAVPTFTNCTQTPGAGGPAIAAKTQGSKTIPATPAGPSEAQHSF